MNKIKENRFLFLSTDLVYSSQYTFILKAVEQCPTSPGRFSATILCYGSIEKEEERKTGTASASSKPLNMCFVSEL